MFDKIVIAGAGKTVESLLERLVRLAPVLVIDTAQTALDDLRIGDDSLAEQPPHPVTRRLGDATSRFVLEEAREDPRLSVALLAATADDRRNIEICRLAQELDFRPIVGIVIEPASGPQYEAHGARTIVRAQILGSVVEQALRYDGLIIASSVGQGRGEIIEFVVLPSSPAIGVPLSQMAAEGWRIAAIYRGSELVIPTGETVIRVEDRILIIGDPNILPSVAEQLRVGVPQFPLRHGNRVVAYLPGGPKPSVEAEAEQLTKKTRADVLLRLYPGATPSRTIYEQREAQHSARSPRQQHKVFETEPLQGKNQKEWFAALRTLRPGVVVTPLAGRSVLQHLTGNGGDAAALCSAVICPVLFSRGAQRYARIVHALISGIADMAFADAAIDLARMLEVPLTVVRVVLPPFIEAPDRHTDQVAVEIERRARAYSIVFESLVLEGNPIRELVRIAQPEDLFVLPRKRTLRDSFTSPDIALRVAAAARCSTLVQTVPPK